MIFINFVPCLTAAINIQVTELGKIGVCIRNDLANQNIGFTLVLNLQQQNLCLYMKDLPIYDETSETGDLGINIVSGHFLKKFTWIFREQIKNDLGIDAHIEITNERREGTGRIIGAQIKAGPSYFQEPTKNGFIFRGKSKHLDYWLNHSLPVIIILCDTITEICYWVEVNRTNVIELSKGWKIVVPRSQIIDIKERKKFVAIAGGPQHPDIVELLIFKFLQEKYHRYSENQIDICPLLHEPRDFHYFTCLANITNIEGVVYVAHYYDLYQDFSKKDIDKFISWRELNSSSCGHSDVLPNLFILLVSERKEKLLINAEIQKAISQSQKVTFIRLLYDNKPFLENRRFYSLTEIDKEGNEIYNY